MKSSRVVLMAVMSAGVLTAGDVLSSDWQYNLPESGLMPSYGKFEWFNRMGERHGRGSELSLQSYAITLPLSDPRRTGWENTMLNVQFDAKVTVANTGGGLTLKHDVLYNFTLPVTFIRKEASGNSWTYGVAPELASDAGAVERGFDVAAFAYYTVKKSETFSYSLGLACSPRFAEYFIVPMVRFEWKPDENWNISLKGYELKAMRRVSERLWMGPFLSARGGVWAVETEERGDRIFRVRSLVLGGVLEYDFSSPGQTKRIITASVGSTLTTNAQFMERNARKDAYANHHYRPALHFSLGVDFRF